MELILVNDLLHWNDEVIGNRTDRVLYVSPDLKKVVLYTVESKEPEKNEEQLPIWREMKDIKESLQARRINKLDEDPYVCIYTPEDFNDGTDKGKAKAKRYREDLEHAWLIIKDIVDREPAIYLQYDRGLMIKEMCKDYGVAKNTVYKYLRRFWAGGKVKGALISHYNKCGAKGREKEYKKKPGRPKTVAGEKPELSGHMLLKIDKQNFYSAIADFYSDQNKNSLQFAYKQMLSRDYVDHYEERDGMEIPILKLDQDLPSFDQFKYWFDTNIDGPSSTRKRVGEVNFEKDFRALLGTSSGRAYGPGALYETDSTIADVYLVSEFDRKRIIGRPIIYAVFDVFTHMGTGLNVTLDQGWVGSMVALENSMTSKREYCAEYGVNISDEVWPTKFVPDAVVGDRGEMESYFADGLAELKIDVKNTPPYRADLKAIVEQGFKIFNDDIGEFVPGAVTKDYVARVDPDYRLDARLTLRAFTQVMIYLMLKHNAATLLKNYPASQRMISDGLPLTPINLWNWGMVNKSSYLRTMSREKIRRHLMPSATASVTESGIYFNGAYFNCTEASERNWYYRARTEGNWGIKISYDPRSMNSIEVREIIGEKPIVCTLLEKSRRFANLSYEEARELRYVEKNIASATKIIIRQEETTYDALCNNVIDEEVRKTEAEMNPEATKTERVSGIKENQRFERKELAITQAWTSNNVVNMNNPIDLENEDDDEELEENRRLGGSLAFLKRMNGE